MVDGIQRSAWAIWGGHSRAPVVLFDSWLRAMITHAKQWAEARGLCHRSEVHGTDEFRIPTNRSFSYENVRGRSIEGSGTGTIADPDGTLLNFSDMGEEIAVSRFGYIGHAPPRSGEALLRTHRRQCCQQLPAPRSKPCRCFSRVQTHLVAWLIFLARR